MTAALFALLALAAPGAAPGRLEARSVRPDMAARRLMGPLFWLHGDESPARLRAYVAKVAEGGNGCFTAESRPHSDWLGPKWWRDLDILLAEAKRHDLKLWIFDEKWWPSGEVAGRVPERYGSKRLTATATDAPGGGRVDAAGFGGPRYVGAVAGRVVDGALDGDSLIDLAPHVRGGRLAWTAPEGQWRVVRFGWVSRRSGSRYLVDGASPDSVAWYIRTVYQPHYDRYRREFGKTIAGFFYDEPETHGDWGTDVMRVLAERHADWKRALAAKTVGLRPEQQTAWAYQYQDAYAEAWGRTLYGGIERWCRARGVKSIGHFLEHGDGYLNPDICAGNMFQLMKYSSMGALDAVFDQFVWGKRVTRDTPIWQTPKLASSITHAYGRPDDVTMVEIFGARGQDLTYPEMKWWTDAMQVAGVNFLIPHSFNPKSPFDTDCPPYFYNGGFEPRWPLYRVFADYSVRLSLMLSGGRHVCPVALLYAGNSAHAGRFTPPEGMSETLQDALYDCDWVPLDTFMGQTRVLGGRLALRDERYRALIVPPAETLPLAALERCRAFFEAGGIVLGYGRLPSRPTEPGATPAQVDAVRRAIWGEAAAGPGLCRQSAKGGRSYFLPANADAAMIQRVLTDDAGAPPTLMATEGRTDGWLHAIHRVKEGRDVFFVANQNHRGAARHFRLSMAARGVPEIWDAMRGEISSIPFRRVGDRVEISMTLEPNESTLIVFSPQGGRRPARIEAAATRPLAAYAVHGRSVLAPPAVPKGAQNPSGVIEGSAWIWFPEGAPVADAPPGVRYLARTFEMPEAPVAGAGGVTFAGAADNGFRLYVNGKLVGSGEDWSRLTTITVPSALVHPGLNVVAAEVTNGGSAPNPAGFIGRLSVEGRSGRVVQIGTDTTWRAWRERPTDWPARATGGEAAMVSAAFGEGPWGRFGGGVTLSPARARPFAGTATLPATALRPGARVMLEMAEIVHEEAARATVNGHEAGGFLGRPLRLDVTRWVRAGANRVTIGPFGPARARLAIYAR